MESIHQARRRLHAAGIDFQSDQGGGFELYRDKQRIDRVFSEAALIAWREEQPIAVVGVPMMNQKEALDTIDWMRGDLEQADRSLSDFRRRAAEFADREGWKALGYTNATEAINAELGTQYSKSYMSRILRAAEIEQILELPIGNSVPESQLRELTVLDTPDQQRAAWQQANTATNGAPTAKAVQQAVQEIAPKPATCIRCGGDRETRKELTSYSAGLVPEYPDRAVTLCSRCIPELLAARRGVELPGADQVPVEPATPAEPGLTAEVEQLRTAFRAALPPVEEEEDEQTPASDRAAYLILQQEDRALFVSAEDAITVGNFTDARQLLGRVQVLTYTRDTMLERIVAHERAAIEAQITMPAEAAPDEPVCWWNCGVPLRAIEYAVNHHDRAGALAAARELVKLFEG